MLIAEETGYDDLGTYIWPQDEDGIVFYSFGEFIKNRYPRHYLIAENESKVGPTALGFWRG